MKKAIGLFSGGLDSSLAVCVMKKQGFEVEGVNFQTPFYGGDERVRRMADQVGITLKTVEIGEEYMEVLKNPVYGYGKNMNPCIDCHGFMLGKAGEYMRDSGACVIITGEVLGQRPMSQNRSALDAVDKISGCRGYVLRPLSARLLKPTIPEQEGLVNRELLLDIQGRSRQRQMALAEEFGLHDYPTPAGGCLLTMESFGTRLRRYFEFQPEAGTAEMEILKIGRHFDLNERGLLVVGRKQAENETLLRAALPQDWLLKVATHPGPTSLVRPFGEIETSDLERAAAITARYSDALSLPLAEVKIWQPGKPERIVKVRPLLREETPAPL